MLLLSLALHGGMWALLVLRPSGLPLLLVVVLPLWGGITNGCWVPAYAQLKDSLPPAVSGTANGFLNFAFFAGTAAFQQFTGALLGATEGHWQPAQSYRIMFAIFLTAVLAALIAQSRCTDAHPDLSTEQSGP